VTAENARTDEDEPTGDVVAVRAALALAAGLLCGFLAARYGHTDIWADVLAGWIAGGLSLGAVGCLLGAGSKSGLDRLQEAGVSVASIVVAWVAVHTVFAVHYAHLYYSGTEGGIDLNQKPKPRYTDFAYVASPSVWPTPCPTPRWKTAASAGSPCGIPWCLICLAR
jgi:hypothetical protein